MTRRRHAHAAKQQNVQLQGPLLHLKAKVGTEMVTDIYLLRDGVVLQEFDTKAQAIAAWAPGMTIDHLTKQSSIEPEAIANKLYQWAKVPQPPPLEDNPNAAIAEDLKVCNFSEYAKATLAARVALGLQKYNTLLRYYDGRNTMADALQEVGDLVFYVAKLEHEMPVPSDINKAALATINELLWHCRDVVSVMIEGME